MAIRKTHHPFVNYGKKTKASYENMKEAKNYLPGGVTANIKHFAPYPIVMNKANGAWVEDVDGNKYIDYLMGYGSLALGHGHKDIRLAINKQLSDDGTFLFGTPHRLEVEFAKRIQEHYPSMEKMRYTNSGTEATLLAIRLARAFTGKGKIAKFEGHYHGGYNSMLYSINPPLSEAGEEGEPLPVPESSGLDTFKENEPIILPFNHLHATESLIKKHASELAAVIVEPVQGGFIPAKQEFMDLLRKVTKKYGIVLIFDEVKTGFRVSLGGAQSVYNISPDLTTLGKAIGGGFPIGLVGGKEKIMATSSPKVAGDVFDVGQGNNSSAKDTLFHSGTYNGHPTILAAGLATIDRLQKEFSIVEENTTILRRKLEHVAKKANVPIKTVGIGTIFSVLCTREKNIYNYRDLQKTNLPLRKEIDYHLLDEGIYTKPLNRYSLSTEHGEEELNKTINAYERVLNSRLEDGGRS
ncbi:aspartate aminotransferase family protein [Evansella cellulosilytica]|uniref:Aminotransferase class-III n=1 Tax=Evansella cellulosilytica (strain ATCC 21833 / DSM 2522 / FERM P-1141 / JCM 9156 / N-4) TaxID=649639 RepID=E6TY12_EVAC2|nr:aspartate aminotransferase family protein [Evansella cellulosilytica]ADU31225.1 aminotransferase class-III [Evansella cellulosilytica DSM 2522]